jgi:hypothetical protein
MKYLKEIVKGDDGEPLGLMESIWLEQEKNKLKKVNLLEELSKPWRMPTTNIIMTGEEGAKIIEEVFKNIENGKF